VNQCTARCKSWTSGIPLEPGMPFLRAVRHLRPRAKSGLVQHNNFS
jgi:hypothetical protein